MDTLKQNIQKYALVSVVKKDLAALKDGRHYVSVYETKYNFEAKTLNCQFTYDKYWDTLVGHFIRDKIFSIELSKKIEDSGITFYKSEFQFLDTILATKYLSEHNSFYSSHKKSSDFFSQKFKRFSYSCGIAGQTPQSMVDCLTIIKNKDRENLISLATSLEPTDRAYGVFGLYILLRTGNNLTEWENKLIGLNQKSKADVYSCSGCLLGIRPLNELLNTKSLKRYYDWYKRTGNVN